MAEESLLAALHRSLDSCDWKSTIFLSDQILETDQNNFEAIFAKCYAFFCNTKYIELEEYAKSLPQNIARDPYILKIRCEGLKSQKLYPQILSILGGDTSNLLLPPLVSLEEVETSEILKPIRDNALFNLSRIETNPIKKMEDILPPTNDPFNPASIQRKVVEAFTLHQPSLLQPFTNKFDHTSNNDALLLSVCGSYQYLNGRTEYGEMLITKATENDPDLELPWLCLLYIYIETAEWDKGLSILKKASRRFPASQSISMFAISLNLKSNSIQNAWQWIQKASMNNTKNYFLMHEKAVALLMGGELHEAKKLFEKIIDEQANVEKDIIAATYLNYGHCLRRLKEFDGAIANYQSALSFEFKQAEALASIGFTYQLIGKIDVAILHYNNCLSVDPVHPFATKMLDLALRNGF
ncbi:Anaphase-promoting complex subunit 6 [Histomonas meleagridis]|uniref:Anaphase-promoting complex subunit 6 n=1 Tax=Histomonas meleagridis TaxID=135588 RepID=UPI0035596567|nr:Anaphase-promoting complex subunit 6 [Histomonas meleagridis]KAH0797030.1 Anaphase-promoting complex subunit 6 [Histomonas meleagridis]